MRELALLEYIYGRSGGLGERVIVGPGDDMAVIRLGGAELLVAVDQVAEGVHFQPALTTLAQIGRKAMTRNLSDVAAMAASPVAAVASAMLPRQMGEAKAKQLFDAMQQVGRQYACPLVGGDVGMWDQPLQISVTVLAEPAGVAPVLRSGAKVGDAVFVSGELGNAWADGGESHLDFEPRIPLARQLAQRLGRHLHSMIDLSDGLGSDLQRICERSGVAAVVDVSALPVRTASRPRPELRQPWQAALQDGEDYELCFTVASEAAAGVPGELEGVKLRKVGEVISRDQPPPGADQTVLGENKAAVGQERGRGVWLKFSDGHVERQEQSGWEHRT